MPFVMSESMILFRYLTRLDILLVFNIHGVLEYQQGALHASK